MHGRTTLIVTHRLATIHNVDQIVAGRSVIRQSGRAGAVRAAAHMRNSTPPAITRPNEQRKQRRTCWLIAGPS